MSTLWNKVVIHLKKFSTLGEKFVTHLIKFSALEEFFVVHLTNFSTLWDKVVINLRNFLDNFRQFCNSPHKKVKRYEKKSYSSHNVFSVGICESVFGTGIIICSSPHKFLDLVRQSYIYHHIYFDTLKHFCNSPQKITDSVRQFRNTPHKVSTPGENFVIHLIIFWHWKKDL